MTGRRGLLLTVVGCVVSAAAMLLSAGQNWLRAILDAQPPLPSRSHTFTGGAIVDSLVPIGIVVGAAGLALIASRRIGRVVVGVVLVVAGLLTLASTGFFLSDGGSDVAFSWAQAYAEPGESLLPQRDVGQAPAVLALFGGGTAVVTGLVTILGSRTWPVMGKRYERQHRSVARDAENRDRTAAAPTNKDQALAEGTATAGVSEAAMWAALDRGEDPTAGPY